MYLTEEEDIKKRWQKYTEELYKKDLQDPDNHDGVITHLEPDILECEVKWALGSITTNKAMGGDGIPVELFQILKDDAVKVLHSICQQVWKTQQWPQDWKRSVFIPIRKKGNAKECSNYCMIALISLASKLMLKIFQARLQQYMNPSQCYGFSSSHVWMGELDYKESWAPDNWYFVTIVYIFWGSQITADGECSHEIKRCLLLGRKVMTNLDKIFKSRDITLPTKVHLVKAMVFPIVMYGCESWTGKKPDCWRIDAFELWCWRRLLRVPWTARRSNQSILKEISPGCSLEGVMLKLNSSTLATSCEELTHWKRLWCWEGLGAGGEGDDRGWDGWMASLTQWRWVWVNSGSWWWTGRPGVLQFMGSQRVRHDWATELNYCVEASWESLGWKRDPTS